MNHPVPEVAISEAEIQERVTTLARELEATFPADEPLLLVGVLKGSFIFLADLARGFARSVSIDFVSVASYRGGTTSTGTIEMRHDVESPLRGMHVILVEDILDTGNTLRWLIPFLQEREPRSLSVCTLLARRDAPKIPVPCHVGFIAPDGFVVGYGLDRAEEFRNLPYIGVL
jgi:hypoxanthine phosphoribosyltransferase